jgi:predicted porin
MKKIAASAACLTALAFSIGTAYAQSSVTIYGTLDVGIDRVEKGEGNVQGTLFGVRGTTPIPNNIASPGSTSVRVSPSHTRQSNIGFKGVEDMGGGYRGLFVLEGGVTLDNGGQANDGRLFGRQAYVGLTTPAGEVKLGRQASPMLIAYYLVTPEALGSTDLFGAGLVVNTLQTWQDNQISYAIKKGPWTGILSYATNSGVGPGISAARATATASTPVATPATGQILGGASAGAETPDGRGKTVGAMLAYRTDNLTALGAYHRNNFGGVPVAWYRAPRWYRCSTTRTSIPTCCPPNTSYRPPASPWPSPDTKASSTCGAAISIRRCVPGPPPSRRPTTLEKYYRCGVICGIRSSKVRPLPFSPIACIFHSPLWRYSLAMIWAVCGPAPTGRSAPLPCRCRSRCGSRRFPPVEKFWPVKLFTVNTSDFTCGGTRCAGRR